MFQHLVRVSGLSNVTDITAGKSHSCALISGGTVKCWGHNGDGAAGLGDDPPYVGGGSPGMGDDLDAVNLGTNRTAVAIAGARSHNCALLNDGTVKCWGYNYYGQLGQGHTNSIGRAADDMGDNLTAIDLGTNKTAVAIDAGDSHTCAVLNDGTVKCWGSGYSGKLGQPGGGHNGSFIGDEADEMGDNLSAIDLGTGRTATAIAAGNFHTVALLDNGTVKAWGRNNYGQLGQGNTTQIGDGADEMGDNLSAVDLGTGRTATAIAAGAYHTGALLDNGTVKFWGYNSYGECGQGNTTQIGDGSNEMGDNLSAVDLGTGRTATAIAGGYHSTIVRLDDGTIKAWGYNRYGELGQGNKTTIGDNADEMGDNLSPIDLSSSSDVTLE